MASQTRVAVAGVGYSTTGRRTGLSSRQLATQAARAAFADCGMTPKDIDGVSLLWTVAGFEPPGVERLDSQDVGYMLGITPLNFFSTEGGVSPAFVAPAIRAVAAIKAGLCHTCIAFRVINQSLNSTEVLAQAGADAMTRAEGDEQFNRPFGSGLPLTSIAGLATQRHMARFGTKEEHFGRHVMAQREFASLNEDAIFRQPLTLDDYFASRYVSKPVRLLDCDYPVDSASAVIFTTEERARDFRKKPVFVEATALASSRYFTFEIDDMDHGSIYHCANTLWSRTALAPKDVSCAQLYDGFTIITLKWLEALGFCPEGEVGPFIADGNTRRGGRLPVNTDGGACNVGRRHGANFCIESVRQLRGECGPRQVPGARVSVWANSTGFMTGAMLMTAD
ncbi:MAG: thiolase family protein [Gammaproteobacteria bacterium]